MKKIVMTGGGTAGHVTPNLALIPRLQADGWEIHYIGEHDAIEQKLISQMEGVQYYGISCGKLRRYFDLKNLTDPARVLKGIDESRRIIHKIHPNIVFSKGGFVSVPVVYGAYINHIPIVCHESDMTPGLANKLSTPLAKCICCTFREAARLAGEKGVYTGTPIRPEILRGSRERGLTRFGLNDGRPVMMVVGGSSGAQAINTLVRKSLAKLTQNFQILHICGKGNLDAESEGTENYVQYEYLNEEMADAYACADIVVSRAGSNTLCELLAVKKPALLIPYPMSASRGDQVLNAQSFEKQGLSKLLMQEDATPESFVKAVIDLYHDRGLLYERIQKEAGTQGVDNVLAEIYRYARED